MQPPAVFVRRTTTRFIGVSERVLSYCEPILVFYSHPSVAPQGRRRRQRTVFTQTNVQQLDSVFVHNQYPDIELRETLAAQMGVPESRIQVNTAVTNSPCLSFVSSRSGSRIGEHAREQLIVSN